MNFEEFITDGNNSKVEQAEPAELEVQKAVVESLAADKAEQDEKIARLTAENEELRLALDREKSAHSEYAEKIDGLQKQVEELKRVLAEYGDVLSRNSESETSNQISLLDRDVEVSDRFDGETRDHVLEVIREARDAAEKDGRVRRAQLLEGVLVANEPVGELAKRRSRLEKLFHDNGNILSGNVLEELTKSGISHKNGDQYLLPDEILKRTF